MFLIGISVVIMMWAFTDRSGQQNRFPRHPFELAQSFLPVLFVKVFQHFNKSYQIKLLILNRERPYVSADHSLVNASAIRCSNIRLKNI